MWSPRPLRDLFCRHSTSEWGVLGISASDSIVWTDLGQSLHPRLVPASPRKWSWHTVEVPGRGQQEGVAAGGVQADDQVTPTLPGSAL